MDRQTESRIDDLKRAAKTWPNKAGMGLDNQSVASDLWDVSQHIDKGVNMLKDSKTPNIRAISEFKAATQLLDYRRNHKDKFDKEGYYRAIYEGGDGSSYESGIYKKVGVDDARDAIQNLIKISNKLDTDSLEQYK